MRFFVFILVLLPAVFFSGCKDTILLEDYIPIIESAEAEVSAEGVLFKTLVSNRGRHNIDEIRFKWFRGNEPLGVYVENGPFAADENAVELWVDFALPPDVPLQYLIEVHTGKQLITTSLREFVALGSKAPAVTSISAVEGKAGDVITLQAQRLPMLVYNGEGLFFTCQVFFGFSSARIQYLDHQTIRFVVPEKTAGSHVFPLRLRVPGHEITFGEFTYTE